VLRVKDESGSEEARCVVVPIQLVGHVVQTGRNWVGGSAGVERVRGEQLQPLVAVGRLFQPEDTILCRDADVSLVK
jgi:hypothetical protein